MPWRKPNSMLPLSRPEWYGRESGLDLLSRYRGIRVARNPLAPWAAPVTAGDRPGLTKMTASELLA
jgi:hypothetical protein